MFEPIVLLVCNLHGVLVAIGGASSTSEAKWTKLRIPHAVVCLLILVPAVEALNTLRAIRVMSHLDVSIHAVFLGDSPSWQVNKTHLILTLLNALRVKTFGVDPLGTRPVFDCTRLLKVDAVYKRLLDFSFYILRRSTARLFCQMLIEQVIIAFLNNDMHGSSEIINVPFINLIYIVLL